jgi:RNA polymerase sigma-70 factor (ECF subfamily)
MAGIEGGALPRAAMSGPDAALLRGLQEWAPDAVGELYDRFGASILTFALAWFPEDHQLAEEIMARSLASALLQIRRYDPTRSSLRTWLHAIARRHLHDELRMQRRRKSVPVSAQTPLEAALGLAGSGDLAAEAAARVDAQRLLARAAAALPRLEYDILVLSCVGELTAREIGRVVGRSERAVHSLLHRAKTKARERLVMDER